MVYGKQYVRFHSFYVKVNDKKPFREFKKIIEKDKPQDLNQVFGLARRKNIKAEGGHYPLDSPIIF